MSGDAALLFIIGSGDDADRITQAGSRIVVTGSSDLTKLLVPPEPHHRLHVTRNYFRQGRQADLTGYKVLLNLITEPEAHAKTLANLKKVLRGVPGRVINKPEAVLRSTRDQVARLLTGIPRLIVPKTARLNGSKPAVAAAAIEKAGVTPPVILRQVGTHSGKIVGLFNAVEEAVAALTPGDHVATQFVDFASADGLYRKYRAFFIGERIVLRHMLVSDHWNVHAKDRARFMAEHPQAVTEERALLESAVPFQPGVREVLEAVRERMPLDFFGMDYGVTRDGEVVLFEANATMSFFPFSTDPQFEYLKRCFAPAQAALRELLGLPPQISRMAQVQLTA
jgi:glutathione synthase/RimK-type ligase-like ATP-grasp enzyme